MNRITIWLRIYYPEVIVFGVIFSVFLLDLAPNLTWMMVDSDGPEYVMDAKYFYPAHHTSAPLYLLTGHLFLQIPFGTDYWRMSLMSAIFTVGSMVFIYLTVREMLKENKKRRLYALVAVAIFGASALVIAQAIIVETYAVVTMFSVGAYYFVIKKNWLMASVMLGMGLVTHHLILLTWVALFAFNRDMRRWKPLLVTFSFLIFYLYMPLSIRFTDQPNMWGNTSFKDFFNNNAAVFTMLVGQVAIYDFPKRILEEIGLLGISLGLALVPITWYLVKKKTWKCELLWLFALPILYPMTDLATQVAKYSEASIAWGAIIAVLALSKWSIKWTYAVSGVAVVMLGIHANYFDLGRTMDKNLAATQFYEEELAKIPDGDIFVTMPAWEWIETYLYNKENGRNIIPVCVGTLASERYQDMLRSKGVKIDSLMVDVQPQAGGSSHDLNSKQVDVALSIIRNNPNVWVSESTEPSVYGAKVMPAKGNEYQISRWLGESNVIPQWRWKPSNPYDIITGSIEVEEWIFILQSSRSVLFVVEWMFFGFFAYWLMMYMWKRKQKGKK